PEATITTGDPSGAMILDTIGGGAAVFDADGDGDVDLLYVDPGPYPTETEHGGTNRLFRNDGGRFADVTAESGVDVGGFSNGVAIADFDSDGDRDVYLTRHGPNVLLRNEGGLRFEPVEDAGGAAGGDEWSASAAFVDLDLDGDLDLYVVQYVVFDPADPPRHGKDGRTCLWRELVVSCGPQGLGVPPDRYYRNDDGRFVDATDPAGFAAVTPGYGLGVVDGDFDEDGWPDVYVSNDSTPNFMFMNRGDGTVEENGVLAGAALSAHGKEQAGMGLAVGDANHDGHEDLFVTNFSNDENSLYLAEGDGWFKDEAVRAGLGVSSRSLLGWGAAFVDVDLDADSDLVALNGHVYPEADTPGTETSFAQPDRLWLNDGRGRFTVTPWPGDAPNVSRALAVGDLDGDRVTDLVVVPLHGRPWIWRGTADPARALQVVVDGPPGNPDGCGTTLVYTSPAGEQRRRVRTNGGFQASSDPRPVLAWTGEGTLAVTFPGGGTASFPVDAPGTIHVPWSDS
ncbi:MAG: FG-GAP repeat domain-containing protein, partial [Planctomycetota bacterium JB042]